MEYMTIAEAAAKWGVSGRRVYQYLQGNRVDDAIRFGSTWMIPAAAQKPGDPRQMRRRAAKSLSAQLTELVQVLTNIDPLPWEDPDSVAAGISDRPFRLFVQGWLAYLRGDFVRTKQNILAIEGESVKLWACSLAVATALSTRDYSWYQQIESYCNRMISAGLGANVTAIAEWALSTAYTSACIPSLIQDWLKDGDFSALPLPLKWEAIYKRARYLQHEKKYQSALDVAQTGLTFCERAQGMSYPGIYLRVSCAASCAMLGRQGDAKKYLTDVMSDCLPHGFITPFAEHAPLFVGLLEQCLIKEFPDAYNAIAGQASHLIPNWFHFHNRLTKDNIPLILTLREYEMSLLAVQRVPASMIAEQFHISLGRCNNIMRDVYSKLNISNREQLSKLIL